MEEFRGWNGGIQSVGRGVLDVGIERFEEEFTTIL